MLLLKRSCAQVWSLNTNTCNFTLQGHDKGINCVDYYHGGEKPYLVSGSDDKYESCTRSRAALCTS